MEPALHLCKNETEFTNESVQWLAKLIKATVAERGECLVGVSGGNTPKGVYTALGTTTDIDWSSVYFFLVDERYTDAASPDSNQRLLQETLCKSGLITQDHLIVPDTSLSLPACIANYTQQLTNAFGAHAPDVLILGMGDDGHIASLFPPVAEADFTEKLVVHTQTDSFAVKDRISVSPLVLMASANPVLLLKGQKKQAVFEECIAAELDPVRWPLHIIQAVRDLTVFIEV